MYVSNLFFHPLGLTGRLSPITQRPGGPVDPVLARVAKRLKATPTQVIFSWVKAKGVVIVTYVTSPS